MFVLSSHIALFFKLVFTFNLHFFLLFFSVLLLSPLIYFSKVELWNRPFLLFGHLNRLQFLKESICLQIHVLQVHSTEKLFLVFLQEFDILHYFSVIFFQYLQFVLKSISLLELSILIFFEKNRRFRELLLSRLYFLSFFDIRYLEALCLSSLVVEFFFDIFV